MTSIHDNVSSKVKFLTSQLKDTSSNLKSLDSLLQNSPPRSTSFYESYPADHLLSSISHQNSNKINNTNRSISKIEQSLDDILNAQNKMETDLKRLSYNDNKSESSPNLRFDQRTLSANNLENIGVPSIESMRSASLNIDKRLRDIQDQMKSDTYKLQQNYSNHLKSLDISGDLHSEVLSRTGHSNLKSLSPTEESQNVKLRQTLAQTESSLDRIKYQLDCSERQLVSETAAKSTLLADLDRKTHQCQQLQEYLNSLQKTQDKMATDCSLLRKRNDNYERLQEKYSIMQRENDELKYKSETCNHATEIDELHKLKDKSDRKYFAMQDQLSELDQQNQAKSDHIDRLMQEIAQLQLQSTHQHSQQQIIIDDKQQLTNQLRTSQRSLQDSTNRIEALELELIQLETVKKNGFSQRDDDIDRLSGQITRQKAEIDRLNQHLFENNQLQEQTQKQNDELRKNLGELRTQIEILRKELESLIQSRSIQDEILKRRDKENQEYIQINKELKYKVEQNEYETNRYKSECDVYNNEMSELRQKLAVQREQLSFTHNNHSDLTDQINTFKSDNSRLQQTTDTLQSQLASFQRQIYELEHQLAQNNDISQQFQQYQNKQQQISQRMQSEKEKSDRDHVKKMTHLEQRLEAERQANEVLADKCDRQLTEINRLHDEYWNQNQSHSTLRRKYLKFKQKYESNMTEKDVEQNLLQSQYENQLSSVREELKQLQENFEKMQEDRDQILRWLISDLDDILPEQSTKEMGSSSYLLKNPHYQLDTIPASSESLAILGGLDPTKCFIEIKKKISLIRSEIARLNSQLNIYHNENKRIEKDLMKSIQEKSQLELEKQSIKQTEIDETKQTLIKLKTEEKNQAKLQKHCNRLQEELQYVRGYLNAQISSCHNIPANFDSSY